MRLQTHRRTVRIEVRLAPEALAIVRRTAGLQGCSVSHFMAAAALEAARKTVTETEIIRLSRRAQERFVSLLLNPPPAADALLRALKRHRSRVVK